MATSERLALPYYENFSTGRLVVITKYVKKNKLKEITPCPECTSPMRVSDDGRVFSCDYCHWSYLLIKVGYRA